VSVDETELAAAFHTHRPRLIRVAYAVLGSVTEAEDVVADTWLRLARAHERQPIDDILGWGTVTVARAALDVLRSARVRRETYIGPWLREPMITAPDPADRVSLDESVRFALLVTLERLTPAERTAWVLHDVFAVPFTQVAEAVGRSPAAVRQLAHRARTHVQATAPRLAVDPAEHDTVVTTLLAAVRAGDLAALTTALDPDVVLTSDGGGTVSAARRPVHGPDHVARLILSITGTTPQQIQLLTVNGSTGLAVRARRAPRPGLTHHHRSNRPTHRHRPQPRQAPEAARPLGTLVSHPRPTWLFRPRPVATSSAKIDRTRRAGACCRRSATATST